ncbi:hypothetical protein [Pseudobacillus badius]|nr:hypothetical protein [Bacillus badius]
MRCILLLTAIVTGIVWVTSFMPSISEVLMVCLYGLFMSLHGVTVGLEKR